MTVSMAH